MRPLGRTSRKGWLFDLNSAQFWLYVRESTRETWAIMKIDLPSMRLIGVGGAGCVVGMPRMRLLPRMRPVCHGWGQVCHGWGHGEIDMHQWAAHNRDHSTLAFRYNLVLWSVNDSIKESYRNREGVSKSKLNSVNDMCNCMTNDRWVRRCRRHNWGQCETLEIVRVQFSSDKNQGYFMVRFKQRYIMRGWTTKHAGAAISSSRARLNDQLAEAPLAMTEVED